MNREITLMDFFRFVLSKLKIVLILGIVAAVVVAGLTYFTAKEHYNFNGSFIVDPFGNVDENFNSNNIYNELTISKTLIPSFVELLQTKDFGEKVAKEVNKKLDTKITAEYVINSTRYTTDDETLIIDFRCTSSSKKLAHTIASTIAKLAPDYVENKLNRVKLNTIGSIDKNDFTIRKTDFKVMGMVAFVITAVLTVLICLIIELLDNRIKSIEDITEHFDYPILGTIPDFYSHQKKEGYYGKPKASEEASAK